MNRFDREIVQQRLLEMQKEAEQQRIARRFMAMKKKK